MASTFASPAQPRTNGYVNTKTDEFGYGAGYGHKTTPSKSNSIEGEPKERETGSRRPGSSGTSTSARLTITNASPSEIPDAPRANGRKRSGSGRAWPTAEDEKQMYNRAKARVEQIQGSVARTPSPVSILCPVSLLVYLTIINRRRLLRVSAHRPLPTLNRGRRRSTIHGLLQKKRSSSPPRLLLKEHKASNSLLQLVT